MANVEAVELRRRWWSEYADVLRASVTRPGVLDKLNALTGELVAAGVIIAGCPMSREGCENIAEECDRLRRLL